MLLFTPRSVSSVTLWLGTTHCTLGIVTRASVTPSPHNDDVTTVHRIHHPIDTSELVAGSNWITSHRCPSSARKQIDCVVRVTIDVTFN